MNDLELFEEPTGGEQFGAYVYVLLRGKEIVYFGSSISICSRIKAHNYRKAKDEDFQFDKVLILGPCEKISQARAIESYFIMKYQPEYNWQWADKKKTDLCKLLGLDPPDRLAPNTSQKEMIDRLWAQRETRRA